MITRKFTGSQIFTDEELFSSRGQGKINNLSVGEEVRLFDGIYWRKYTNWILPYIDYEYLKKYPKIIIGYSDTTALLLAIYAKTGLVTFYGPAVASSFGELPLLWTGLLVL